LADATQAYVEALAIYKQQLNTEEDDHHVQEIRQDLQQLDHIQAAQQKQKQQQQQIVRHDSSLFLTSNRTTPQAA
jgi:uncharacterized protein YacL (UPF0231 family)